MSTNKTFNKVQLDVKFTQATSRVNLISEENISISFGKISKYFADLHSQAFTGYTHPTYTARTGKPTGNQTPGFGSTFTISQITSDGTGHVTAATDRTVKIPDTTMGAASADAAGSKGLVPAPAAGKQTSFLRGDGTWAVPTNTDTKVTQSQTTTTNYRPILFGANNSTDVSTLANTITDQAYTSTKMYAQPSTGLIYCTGRKIENVTIQTGSTKQAHITLQTLMTWLITTKTYIPSGQYCHVIISTTWQYANNDILQVSIDGTNYEIQLAGVIIEFIGGATSYNAGMFRLLIHSSPTINFTATSGYSKFPVSTIAEYTCNGSDYSPTWKKIWNSHPTYTSKSSGLYKITVDGTGHVSAATAVAKADITALGIPGSDTNTTYTIATGDSNGQIKVTPSSGSAYNVSVKGLGSAAYTSSTSYAPSVTGGYLPLSGGTMTGDITFASISGDTYPISSKGIKWGGGTDAIDMYYNLRASDTGELIINMRDDTNVRISFAYNGTVKSYIDTNGTYNGNASTATKLGTANKGSTTKGIYLDAGVPKEMTYSLGSTVNAGTANQLAYYSGANSISTTHDGTNTNDSLYFKTGTNAKSARQIILGIYGQTYGNDAATLISGTAGVFSYGDGGPQIDFNTSSSGSQAGALIFTDHDTAGAGASWHFVSNQSDWNVTSKRFHARTSISIGTDKPTTSYNLYVNGTTNITGDTTVDGNIMITSTGTLIQKQNSGSNWTTAIKWWSGGTDPGNYGPCIAQHNTGGDSTYPGSITILPYHTTTQPWNGSVGLFIKKDHVYIDGVELSKSGHTHSYLPLSGTTINNPNTSSVSFTNGMTGNILFTNTGGTNGVARGIGGIVGASDSWSVRGYQTGDNKGCLEIAVGDDGDEGIYVRQYTSGAYKATFSNNAGSASGLTYRELVLMAPSTGASTFPSDVTLSGGRLYLSGSPGNCGQLNLKTTSYNVMLRNDNANTYVLLTAQGDPDGSWTSARPLMINNSTGICSINGNAATATSWATARTLTLSGQLTGSVSVKGDANMTLKGYLDRAFIYDDNAVPDGHTWAEYAWHKFAEVTITTTFTDCVITFLVSRTYGDSAENTGILSAKLRTNGSKAYDSAQLKWLVRNSGLSKDDFVMVYTSTSGTSTKAELWCRIPGQYHGLVFNVLKEHKRQYSTDTSWTLVKTPDGTGSTHGSSSYPTTGITGTIISSDGTITNSTTGTSSNVTGTVAIANGGTGATTRLGALKALTNEGVGTSATYFLTITDSWGKGGYSSVANVKTVLGLKSAAYTESSDYVPNTQDGMNAAINLLSTGSSNPGLADYYVSQYANGGTTTKSYHRRPISALWNTFKGLITLETTGSGNAVTDVSIANDGDHNRKITVTKGSTFSLSTHTHSYLPLNGGSLSGSMNFKSTTYDGSAANNGVSSGVSYPTTFNILDKSSRILVRLEGVINSTGAIGSYWYIRNYNTSGTQVGQKGISMTMAKDGTLTYAVADGDKFRSAIGAGTSNLTIGTTSTTAAAGDHGHGLLHSNLTQAASNGTTGGWSVIGIDPAVNGYVLKSIRVNTTSPNWLSGDYGAGIAFGGSDTKGVISMKYDSPVITFAGGNHSSSKTEPVWYLKISGTSGSTYNLDNLLSTTLLEVTESTNLWLDGETNAFGYVSGLTKDTWNFQQTDGTIIRQRYNILWKTEIFMDYRTGQMSTRGKNNGKWQDWRIHLDSGNYTSYTVTKTGSGASGTWGISITGNASTSTKATQDGDGNTISSTYLKLSGGKMAGTIQGTSTNTHIALAGGGIGDYATLDHKNNINISSWYGVSISNGCSNAGTLDQVTFSVNARTGTTQQRGHAILYSASGDSPALIFQRGTFVDNLNDWKIYVSGGELRFAQSTANASSETWTTKMYFHASDGNLYVGSKKVSLNGHTHNYAGSSSAGGAATWATLLKAISTTTTASASTWNIPSGSYQVWGERFSDTRLKYTPSGGSETTITDTGDLVMWLTGNATSNQATLNMRIDGTYYGSFSGNVTGNVTGNVNGKLYHTGTSSSWWNDRDNAVIRITTGDTGYRPLWTLLTATSGSWGMGNHTGDDLTFNFISKAVYDSKKNPSTNAQIKFTNTGGITATGSITANKFYGDITGSGLNAGIYDLLNVDDPTFNGAEWMLTSIPSSPGGTSEPSFRRVKTAKFADYVNSVSRDVLFNDSTNTSKSITLSDPPTDTQYLKLYFKSSGNMGQTTMDNSVYSIAEVPYMTDVNLGGILQVAQPSDNTGVLKSTVLAFTIKITNNTLTLTKAPYPSRLDGSAVANDTHLSANIIKVVAYR